jgi:hypothetical protein
MVATSVVGTRWYVLCEDMLSTLSAIAGVVANLVVLCAVCAEVKEKFSFGQQFHESS